MNSNGGACNWEWSIGDDHWTKSWYCTGAEGEGSSSVQDCFCLPESDDERLLARLKMSDVTPLGRWRGFRLHYEWLYFWWRPSSNWMIASTTAYTEVVLS